MRSSRGAPPPHVRVWITPETVYGLTHHLVVLGVELLEDLLSERGERWAWSWDDDVVQDLVQDKVRVYLVGRSDVPSWAAGDPEIEVVRLVGFAEVLSELDRLGVNP